MQNRAIFCLNLLLCAGIAAVWALTPAWRRRPAESAVPSEVVPVAVSARADEAKLPLRPAVGEAQALRGEIREVRAEANAELEQIREHSREKRERWQGVLPAEAQILSFDEFQEACPEGMSPELYEQLKQSLLSGIEEDAKNRAKARQVILDALAESSATDEEYRQVQEWFAQLDEFDANVTLRDYTEEEFPRHPYENMKLCNILYRALEGREERMNWNKLFHLLNSDDLGFFVLLPEDVEKISTAVMGRKAKRGKDE